MHDISSLVCGLDVHKDSVYATVMSYGGEVVDKRKLSNDGAVGFLGQSSGLAGWTLARGRRIVHTSNVGCDGYTNSQAEAVSPRELLIQQLESEGPYSVRQQSLAIASKLRTLGISTDVDV